MLNKLFPFSSPSESPEKRPFHALAEEAAYQHHLSPQDISPHALEVVERLQRFGYQAYIVGGCIRDLLLHIRPKDYDVATNATPEQVRDVIQNARIIGRRFKLVHIPFGRELIEVATFRADHASDDENTYHTARNEHGRILRDNAYGTLEQDAYRRDFTVNALYYNPTTEQILDHVQGVRDIRNRRIRLIGNPEQRYLEDPVRMLRAIRFAAKLDFELEPSTRAPIRRLAPLLKEIPAARLFDEVLKLFLSGHAEYTFELLQAYNLFEPLFPETAAALKERPEYTQTLIRHALVNTDLRIRQGKPVTPTFLFAALLWPALPLRALALQAQGIPALPALQEAAHETLWAQCQHTAMPKRFSIPVREIWDMQERLPRRSGKRAELLVEHPRFRAAYDFLLLREAAGEQTQGLGLWWTQYQEASDKERRLMVRALSESMPADPRKRRRSQKRY